MSGSGKRWYLEDVEQQLVFAGGVNLNRDSKAIADAQSVKAQNLFPTQSGILEKRPGLIAEKFVSTNSILSPFSQVASPIGAGFDYVGHMLANDSGTEFIWCGNLPDIGVFNTTLAQNNLAVDIGNTVSGSGSNQCEPLCYAKFGTQVLVTRKGGVGLIQNVKGLTAAGVNPSTNTPTFFGYTFTNDGQTQKINMTPAVVATWKGRAFYANFGIGMGHWGVLSDATGIPGSNSPNYLIVGSDCLASNGRHIEFQQIAGETIIGAFESILMMEGSPTDSALVILTQKSMLILTGDFSQTTDTGQNSLVGTLSVAKVNFDVGLSSPNTIVRTPYGVVWASATDVWMLQGNTPVKIGTNITQALQNTPPEAVKWWTAAYCKDPGVYILDIITARGTDDSVLVHNQWWLQLNDAVMPQNANQAMWYGPMIVQRDCGQGTTFHGGVCLSKDETNIVKLVTDKGYGDGARTGTTLVSCTTRGGSDDISFQMASTGRIWQPNEFVNIGEVIRPTFTRNNGRLYVAILFSGNQTTGATEPHWDGTAGQVIADFDITWMELTGTVGSHVLLPPTDRYSPYRALNYDAPNDTPQTDITNSSDFRTKAFAFGEPGLAKMHKRMEVSAYSSIPMVLPAYAISNGGSVNRQCGQSTFGQTYGLAADDGVDGTIIGDGEFQARSMRPLDNAIVRGQYIQYQLTDVFTGSLAGKYVLDPSNNSLVFGVITDDPFITLYEATIALDPTIGNIAIYNDIEGLINAMLIAMNAAIFPFGNNFGSHRDIGGIDVPSPSPFTFQAHVSGAANYFQNIKLVMNNRGNSGDSMFALFHGASDGVALNPGNSSGLFVNSGVYDLRKSRRLMAILGFDNDTTPGLADLTIYSGPATVFYRPEVQPPTGLPANSGVVWAQNQVAHRRTGRFQWGGGVIIARPTNVPPLSNGNR